MVEKRVIVISLIFLLGVSVLVSAFSFGDLFGTGKAVDDSSDVVWEIEEDTGICLNVNPSEFCETFNTEETCADLGSKYCEWNENEIFLKCGAKNNDITNNFSGEANRRCISYDASGPCEQDRFCSWETQMTDFPNNEFQVNEGWNLIWGFFHPSQISYSEDLTPENVKAIYLFDPVLKEYVSVFPNVTTKENNFDFYSLDENGEIILFLDDYLVASTTLLTWVYFDKPGTFRFRLSDEVGGGNPFIISTYHPLIEGWNFVGVVPGMFEDHEGVDQDSFTLNDTRGTCRIEKAYFFGGSFENQEITNEWVEIPLDYEIQEEELYRAIAIKVGEHCLLGKIDPEKVCVAEPRVPKRYVSGNVTVYNEKGDVIDFASDFCVDEDHLGKTICIFGEWRDFEYGGDGFEVNQNGISNKSVQKAYRRFGGTQDMDKKCEDGKFVPASE